MSLFIGGLAFAEGGSGYASADRLGILAGSLASGLLGYLILRFTAASRNA
jgi:NhaA family Na+:H+ antiporter